MSAHDFSFPARDGGTIDLGDYKGKAVLVERGNCTFTAKAVHAQAAVANAVIIYNNKEEGPTPMGDAGENEYAKKISIPVVCISQADGVQLAAAINARKTTISLCSGACPPAVAPHTFTSCLLISFV